MDDHILLHVDIRPGTFWDARPMVPLLFGVKAGDIFYAIDGRDKVKVIVEMVNYFRDFGDAWFTLDKELVRDPDVVTTGNAIKYFQKYFEQSFVDRYGIIAMKLRVIK